MCHGSDHLNILVHISAAQFKNITNNSNIICNEILFCVLFRMKEGSYTVSSSERCFLMN